MPIAEKKILIFSHMVHDMSKFEKSNSNKIKTSKFFPIIFTLLCKKYTLSQNIEAKVCSAKLRRKVSACKHFNKKYFHMKLLCGVHVNGPLNYFDIFNF